MARIKDLDYWMDSLSPQQCMVVVDFLKRWAASLDLLFSGDEGFEHYGVMMFSHFCLEMRNALDMPGALADELNWAGFITDYKPICEDNPDSLTDTIERLYDLDHAIVSQSINDFASSSRSLEVSKDA